MFYFIIPLEFLEELVLLEPTKWSFTCLVITDSLPKDITKVFTPLNLLDNNCLYNLYVMCHSFNLFIIVIPLG